MTRLRNAFDTPDTKRRYVRQLFSTIADRYDLITVALSYGRDRYWKRYLVDHAFQVIRSTGRIDALDLACGTGDIAFALSARSAAVVGLDITHRMVELAQAKQTAGQTECRFLVGDMMALPFPDAHFDLVTAGYGLRNVPMLHGALLEIHRVLRPGGCLLSLDFDRPANGLVRTVYLGYLALVGSLLGTVLHGDPDTYRYIPASIRHYPGAVGVASLMQDVGFAEVGYKPLLGGLMAINYGRREGPWPDDCSAETEARRVRAIAEVAVAMPCSSDRAGGAGTPS